MADSLPKVSDVYAGSKILITGFTGFIGKLVAEKLLWQCPNLDTLFIMIRDKKGAPKEARLQDILNGNAYKRIRENFPERLKKLVPVTGEIMEEDLALSDEGRRQLMECDFIIHCAATVRFDHHLTEAVNINTRATKVLLDLALEMPHLKSFVHVSTAYTNCNRRVIGECLYPPPNDWQDTIKVVNHFDMGTIAILTNKIVENLPNTYIYSKALAEHVINDYKDKLPVVICRPSVVVCAHEEPMVGYFENFYGPIGMAVGYFYGIMRCSYNIHDTTVDYVFVDPVVKNIILAGWKRAIDPPQKATDELEIYNCCSGIDHLVRCKQFVEINYRSIVTCVPDMDYMTILMIENYFLYWLTVLYRHVFPGYVLDKILQFRGQEAKVMKLRTKIFSVTKFLKIFVSYSFVLVNDKFQRLWLMVPDPEERKAFECSLELFNPEYYEKTCIKAAEYLLKYVRTEVLNEREKTRRQFKLMYFVDHFFVHLTHASVAALIIYFAFYKQIFNQPLSVLFSLVNIFDL